MFNRLYDIILYNGKISHVKMYEDVVRLDHVPGGYDPMAFVELAMEVVSPQARLLLAQPLGTRVSLSMADVPTMEAARGFPSWLAATASDARMSNPQRILNPERMISLGLPGSELFHVSYILSRHDPLPVVETLCRTLLPLSDSADHSMNDDQVRAIVKNIPVTSAPVVIGCTSSLLFSSAPNRPKLLVVNSWRICLAAALLEEGLL